MSNNPSLSEEFPGRGGGGDRSIDDGGANTKQQLTPQQLRDQRLARLGGGNSKGPTRKSHLKDPPPSSSMKLSATATATATSSSVDRGLMKPPSTYTTTFSDNSSSKSIDACSTKPLATTDDSQAIPSPSPDILGNPIEVTTDIFQDKNKNNIETSNSSTSSLEGRVALRVASLAEKEDEDLQAALALSMGLPMPPSKFVGAANSDFEPLLAFETGAEITEPTTSRIISNDALAAAAMVVATSPGSENTPASTAPSTPMRMEEDDTDVIMESDDRKPAAIVVGKKATANSPSADSSSRILRSNPQHFSGRVRTWYETASSYNVLDFHDCMWDKGITTENDQKRWLAQGIQFKDEHDDDRKNYSSSPKTRAGTDASSLLAMIISGPGGEYFAFETATETKLFWLS